MEALSKCLLRVAHLCLAVPLPAKGLIIIAHDTLKLELPVNFYIFKQNSKPFVNRQPNSTTKGYINERRQGYCLSLTLIFLYFKY